MRKAIPTTHISHSGTSVKSELFESQVFGIYAIKSALMRSSLGGSRRRRRHLPADQWEGYLRNLGVYNGHRAVCDGKGTILADFRTEVVTERFRSGENENDEFLLWRTAVRTADGLEKSDEEWSRGELAEFGALAADGSYTLGPTVYIGEQFVVEQCLSEDSFRIRSIHAFDWEGRLCGLTACREKRIERRGEAASDVSSLVPSLTSSSQGSQIEPAAWRSPSVLLDYMLGTWTGRGIIVDKATGITRLVRSEHRWKQTDELMVRQISSLVVEGSSQRKFWF